jgi:hypothetical protein
MSRSIPLNEEYIHRYPKEYIHRYPKDDSLAVNWCSATDIQANNKLFSEYQRYLFALIERKKKHYSYSFQKGNYFENIYPIVASCAPFDIRVAFCGRRTSWNGSGSCQKWRFCSHCAFIKKMIALQSLLPAFGYRHFAFLTISFDGSLRVENTLRMSQILRYWNAIDLAIKHLRNEHIILGAFFVEELFLRGFLPLRVLPHVHCVLHVASGEEQIAQVIRDETSTFLLEHRGPGGAPLALLPSVESRCIRTERRFANALQYLTKSVDLIGPYNSAVATAPSFDDSIATLNRELRGFLTSWVGVTQGRQAIRRIGTMHQASKEYIGTKNWTQAERKVYVAKYFESLRDERRKRGGFASMFAENDF